MPVIYSHSFIVQSKESHESGGEDSGSDSGSSSSASSVDFGKKGSKNNVS